MANREEILLVVRLATSKVDGMIMQVPIVFAILMSSVSTIFFKTERLK